MSRYTVIGGNGFIGGNLVRFLLDRGEEVWAPARGDKDIFTSELGIVFYCAGFGDCKNDPENVLDANVIYLSKILKESKFKKLFYFSTTRVYMNLKSSNEKDNVSISYGDNRRLFNLTKLIAEELCLKNEKNCYILRPSNVYGVALESPLFLPSIIRSAILDGKVDMFVTQSYEKDYISVNDVSYACYCLSKLNNIPRIINIASGLNTNAKQIADLLKIETGCKVLWHKKNNDDEEFPVTSIDCLKNLIEFNSNNVLDDIKSMVSDFKKNLDV